MPKVTGRFITKKKGIITMAKDFTRLDNVMKGFIKDGKNPGCGVAIFQNDELLFESYAGYSNIEEKKPITRDSIFRQASTTKLFTYAILGMLYEEGKFLFSDPLYEYLPEWKNTKKFIRDSNNAVRAVPVDHPITIRNAVAMMCGLPYCMFPNPNATDPTLAAMSRQMAKLMEEKGQHPTLRDEVRVMSEVPIMFEPGTHWQYGFGSEITGALVETWTGKTLREVFKERIIDPLGLTRTATYIDDDIRDFVVTQYRRTPEGELVAMGPEGDSAYDPAVHPMGARVNLLSSPYDFAIFMQMLANGGTYKGERYLSEGTVNMLHENQLSDEVIKDFTNDYLAGYGYGLGFRTLMTQKYGHNGRLGCFGWTGGAGTWAEADPVDKLSIVYMHNMMPNDELYHHHRVRAAAYGCLLGD